MRGLSRGVRARHVRPPPRCDSNRLSARHGIVRGGLLPSLTLAWHPIFWRRLGSALCESRPAVLPGGGATEMVTVLLKVLDMVTIIEELNVLRQGLNVVRRRSRSIDRVWDGGDGTTRERGGWGRG